MRLYELTFIIHPDADEEQQDAIKQRIGDIASQNGGEVVSVRDWGHRKLAYPIRKQTSGFYVTMRLRMEPPAVAELQPFLRLSEDILRYLIVRADEVPAEP